MEPRAARSRAALTSAGAEGRDMKTQHEAHAEQRRVTSSRGRAGEGVHVPAPRWGGSVGSASHTCWAQRRQF